MGKTFSRLWVHIIFGVKGRLKLLNDRVRQSVLFHIQNDIPIPGLEIHEAGGYKDHIHLLTLIHPRLSVSWIVKKIKGESSHLINERSLLKYKFGWQPGYSSFSVSESMVEVIKDYIKNQEKHHRKMSFEEELEKFFKKNKLKP